MQTPSKLIADDHLSALRLALCGLVAVAGYYAALASPLGAGAILIALPAIFLVSRVRSARQAFYLGFALGICIYAPHLIFFLRVFGPAAVLLFLIAGFPIAIFILLLHQTRNRWGQTVGFLATPMLWTGIEFFRSELYPLRFAWLLPGQAAALLRGVGWLWIGVYGAGFVYALAAAMVVASSTIVRLLGVTAILLLAALMYWPTRPVPEAARQLHVAGVRLDRLMSPW